MALRKNEFVPKMDPIKKTSSSSDPGIKTPNKVEDNSPSSLKHRQYSGKDSPQSRTQGQSLSSRRKSGNDSTTSIGEEFSSKLASIHRNSSHILAISSFSPICPSLQIQGLPGSDPVLDTIYQLKTEDRTDRDLCCGLLSRFRSAFKAGWMLMSVIVVWVGFLGPYQCSGIPLVSVYVTAFGFVLILYLIFGEISGVIAIWKGRRIGLSVLTLTQVFLLVWIVCGYFVLPIPLSQNSNSTVVQQSSPQNITCPVPHLCDCTYFNFVVVLFALAHIVIVFVLVYILVVCLCVTKAASVRKHQDKVRNREHVPSENPRNSKETKIANGKSKHSGSVSQSPLTCPVNVEQDIDQGSINLADVANTDSTC